MAAIQSGWAPAALQLTGVLNKARWSGAGSMNVPNLGSILVQNDAHFLYVGLTSSRTSAMTREPATAGSALCREQSHHAQCHELWPVSNQPNHRQAVLCRSNQWTGLLAIPARATPNWFWRQPGRRSPTGCGIKIPLVDAGGSLNLTRPCSWACGQFENARPHRGRAPGQQLRCADRSDAVHDPAVQLAQFQANPQSPRPSSGRQPRGSCNATPPTPANMMPTPTGRRSEDGFTDGPQVALRGCCRAASVPLNSDGLTDAPTNVNPNINGDTNSVMESVSASYMWKLS